MNSSTNTSNFEQLFEQCNRTELRQLLGQMGLKVDGNLTMEDLLAIARGEKEEVPSALDKWRFMIMSFLLDHWAQTHLQLTCPAKSGNPDSCFGCTDAQVAYCIVENQGYLPLIRRYESMFQPAQVQMHTIDNVNTDPKALADIGIVIVRRLADELVARGFPMFENDQQKTSWLTMDPMQRAIGLSQAIIAYRQQTGAQQVLPTQPVQPAQPVAVAPAPAVPQPMPAPKPQVPKVNGSPVVGNSSEMMEMLRAMQTSADSQTNQVIGNITALRQENAALRQEIAQLKQTAAVSLRFQKTMLGLLNIFGQQILQVSPKDILQIGEETGDSSLRFLQELWSAQGEGQ